MMAPVDGSGLTPAWIVFVANFMIWVMTFNLTKLCVLDQNKKSYRKDMPLLTVSVALNKRAIAYLSLQQHKIITHFWMKKYNFC
jgi:hypothetical protein